MKAAVCYEKGQPLVVEDLELAPPQRGEVKVKLAATAICHSDVHLVRGDWGQWGAEAPVVAGHESAGVVVEIGEGVTLAQPGDHVVVSLMRSCGRCFFCTTGTPHLCEGNFALASESRLRNGRGETINHGIKVAGFAEYSIVDQSQVVPIPADMPLDAACLLACGVITGYGAVINTGKFEPGSSAVVIGTGGVGLNSIQAAALSGAYPLVAVDLLDNKLAAAKTFGATHTVNSRQQDPVEIVKSLTSGRGADYVFVTVGSDIAVAQSMKLVRRGGTRVLAGMPARNASVPLGTSDFVWDAYSLLGSTMGSARLHNDVPRLAEMYRAGKFKLDELITARYPLEQINEAIESMERGEALRNVIVFS